MFKKIWNWIMSDFDKGYDQEPLLPHTLKEWLILISGSVFGLILFVILIYWFRALEIFIYSL